MQEPLIIEAGFGLLGTRTEDLRANAAVLIAGGVIEEVGDAGELKARRPNADVRTFPRCLMLPGLINSHQHGRGLSQIQLGYHDDFLEPWIAGRRGRGILDSFAITRLAAARMIANGVTTAIHANYSYGTGDYEAEVRNQIRAYSDIGIRVTMCVGAMDQGGVVYPPHEACFMGGLAPDLQKWLAKPASAAYAGDASSTIALMHRLRADHASKTGVRFCYGPAGPQWVSDELWRAIARDATENGLGIHLHALESPAQRDAVNELFPEGVFSHLEKLGAMTPRTVVAHGVWVEDRDMEVLARTGATVVRNPGCNIRMRNGIAPLARYLQKGVRVAIGTDNCSVADDEDLLAELRLAGQLAREPDWNSPSPPSVDALVAMATINGAVAAQFGSEVGILEPGRRADIAVFSLDRTANPYLDDEMPLLEAFIARGQGAETRMTMVDGTILYQDGRYTRTAIEEVERAAVAAAQAARHPIDLNNRDRAKRYREHLCAHYRNIAGGSPGSIGSQSGTK